MTSFHPQANTDARTAVGIDLGTTYSAVAWVNKLGKPEILPNREGENITPSVVLFDEWQPIVGAMAKRSVTAAPLDVVQFVKRSMGDPAWRFDPRSGPSWRPEEVSALILKRLKEDAERALQTEVTDAVITVPAYFDDAPRRATIDAGTIAGLNVLRVLNEPTAAALAHGVTTGHEGHLLVYDLGGGTFDVTVLRIAGGDFRVLATHGDRNLGGFDFDNALMRLLNARFIEAGGPDLLEDDLAEVNLRERTEIAKHSLTTAERTTVALSADGFSTTVVVTRAEFEDACSSLLSRTRDISQLVLEDAGIELAQLDRLLLAGGATRMPMVRAMLTDLTGATPEISANPDEAIAHGAAIQAEVTSQEAAERSDAVGHRSLEQTYDRGTSGIQVRDVTSQGLGVYSYKLEAGETQLERNSIIIPPNTPIPAEKTKRYYTLRDGQDGFDWTITQGNDEDPQYVRVIANRSTELPRSYPAKSPVDLTFRYDANQVVQAVVADISSGSEEVFEIRSVYNMTDAEVGTSMMRMRRIEVD